jgi:hypothetical protein
MHNCALPRPHGIAAPAVRIANQIWMAVANFSDFPEADDPCGQHDSAQSTCAVDMEGVGEKISWK